MPISGGGGQGGPGRAMGFGGGGFGGPQLSSAQGYVNPNYSVDAAIKWDIIKNIATLAFSISDIFKTKKYSSYSETAYFTQNYTRQRDAQIMRVNFSYRFGKMDASLFKRKNNNVESEPIQGL